MATSALTLLVPTELAPAIIGPRGSAVRRISGASGAKIHLSDHIDAFDDRKCTISGTAEQVLAAYHLVSETLRQAANIPPSAPASTRVVVPDAPSLVGEQFLASLRTKSGASIASTTAPPPAGAKERLLTITARAETQVSRAIRLLVDALAARKNAREANLSKRWDFATEYKDHFETPQRAFADVLPILRHEAEARHGGDLSKLVVYDPYYCYGAVVGRLAALGLSADRIVHRNRDFYADVAAGTTPPHDAFVTNPPYSADHKERLLAYLLAQRSGAPFLLLVPAWLVGNAYWRKFLRKLAKRRAAPAARRGLERRAGIFYVAPCGARYEFAHPEATGKTSSPFHGVWACGGWGGEAERRAAMAALRPLRRAGQVAVFRKAKSLRKRGLFEHVGS